MALQSHKNISIAALSLALLICAFLISFHEILLRTAKKWMHLDGAYGLLIFAISMYMIWDMRKKIAQTPAKPSFFYGLSATIVGCGIYLISKASNTLVLQGIAIIVTLLGLAWLILGTEQIKLLVIPVGYLAFMFSFFEELLGIFSMPLQRIAAHLSGFILNIFGMPVFVSGEFIELPHITLEVAKVCNGENHIIAIVALSIPIAVKAFTKLYKRIAIIGFGFLAGVFANGMRVALIGWWTVTHHEDSIHGPFEIFYVSFILIFGLVLVGGISFFFRHKGNSRQADFKMDSQDKIKLTLNLGQYTVSFLIAAGILFSVLAYQYLISYKIKPTAIPLSEFPSKIGEWQGKSILDKNWPFKHITGDESLRRVYINRVTGNKVGLLITYYNRQTQDKEVINQKLMWLHLKSKEIPIQYKGDTVEINKGVPRGLDDQSYSNDMREFYFWYFANGKILTNPYEVKVQNIISSLARGESNAAMIVISTENKTALTNYETSGARSFIREAFPHIIEHLYD